MPTASSEKQLRIAYIGPSHGTSLLRARALERLGHKVNVIDPWSLLGRSEWVNRWLHHTGGVGIGLRIDRPLFKAVVEARPQLIFVNQGEFLGSNLVRTMRKLGVPLINYTNDNPFSGRDGLRFHRYMKSIPHYDLIVVTFEENVLSARAAGAKKVMRVWLSADEIAHSPRNLPPLTEDTYCADVAFIGTWMPERGPFVAELIRKGVPISIWGDQWHKAAEWPFVAPHWRGPGVYDYDAYAKLVQSSKICLGLLSKGNRNLHTGRSMEIPSLGSVLCAERTTEHLQLYEEGEEAIFWGDADECAAHCHALLADENRRKRIAAAGHARAVRNGHYNEIVLAKILLAAMPRLE